MAAIGIPIKLLHGSFSASKANNLESQGHVLSLELSNGNTFRGKLLEAEDNMNLQLKDVTVTARNGQVSHMDQVYIRGSHIRFVVVPDMLKNAPMFKYKPNRGRGSGRGRTPLGRVLR